MKHIRERPKRVVPFLFIQILELFQIVNSQKEKMHAFIRRTCLFHFDKEIFLIEEVVSPLLYDATALRIHSPVY